MRTIYKALSAVQADLKAPKANKNTFGNYNYRSAEDILEAVKPILKTHELAMTLSDKVVQVGDKNYIESTVTVFDLMNDSSEPISVTAYAREADDKKGMDVAQITGAASSYARKYALNGMFNIDDTKDPDTDEHTAQRQKATAPKETRNRVEESKQAEPFPDTEYTVLKDAKADIKLELESQGFMTPEEMQGYIKSVIGKETIDSIDDAHVIAEALDGETPHDFPDDIGAKG